MRTAWEAKAIDCCFEDLPRFGEADRRLSGLAMAAWAANGYRAVAGFDDNSVLIADPAGLPTITAVAGAVASAFGLSAGMQLSRWPGPAADLAAELAAACDLIALMPLPVPFERSFQSPERSIILARGVALPLFEAGVDTDNVQIILSWREVLNRAATMVLRRELADALSVFAPYAAKIDPFADKSLT